HRGLTHSLPFAFLVGCVAAWIMSQGAPQNGKTWIVFIVYFFIVTASHGLLDAMTNGGLGVAFFAPFSNARYFFPWRPIEVSPLSVRRFFSRRGVQIMCSELQWVWLPAAGVCILGMIVRRYGYGGLLP